MSSFSDGLLFSFGRRQMLFFVGHLQRFSFVGRQSSPRRKTRPRICTCSSFFAAMKMVPSYRLVTWKLQIFGAEEAPGLTVLAGAGLGNAVRDVAVLVEVSFAVGVAFPFPFLEV